MVSLKLVKDVKMKDELDFLNELLHHVDGIECPKAWELITNRIQSLTAEEEG